MGETEPPKEKKKERKIVKPVPPPSVSTALVILRGAVAGVLGCSIGGESSASLMQPSFIKDKTPTGKFSVNLGKKNGTLCEIEIPEDEDGQNLVLDAIEREANKIINDSLPIVRFQMMREDAENKYGNVIFDDSQKKPPKKKSDQPLDFVFIDGLILAIPPGPTFSNTSQVKGIKLIKGSVGTTAITAGKNSRKSGIVIKFEADGVAGSEASTELAEPIDNEKIPSLTTTNIRLQEGQKLMTELTAKTNEALSTAEEPVLNESTEKNEDMVVDPFTVSGKIDYTKLVDDFGSKVIDPSLLARLEELTVKRGTVPNLHRFLRRNIFFSHRDLEIILDQVEQNKPLFLYTGRGPSSSAMHMGHLVPFMMTQWLQEAFQCPLVIQMTDDEKFLFKGKYEENNGYNLDHFYNLTMENAKDIIACGFDPEKTFIFSDLDYVGKMYPNICKIWKSVTTNTVNGIFGFDGSSNIGKMAFPAIQAAPSFASSFPEVLNVAKNPANDNMACLIPCAIDQDPYFRMTRDVAHKLVRNPQKHPLKGKPALIHSKFFPPLQGAMGKMSSSDDSSAIFLTDSPDQIGKKIKKHAFSGGRETKELQQELGGDLEIDVSYQWLRFFLEDDDELEKVKQSYGSGQGEYWSSSKVKEKLIGVVKELVSEHQRRRAEVTDDVVRKWMKERCLV